ncbi:MAG TPA: hypothetical protein VF657_25320, partial [Actinoplanes sp.]
MLFWGAHRAQSRRHPVNGLGGSARNDLEIVAARWQNVQPRRRPGSTVALCSGGTGDRDAVGDRIDAGLHEPHQ